MVAIHATSPLLSSPAAGAGGPASRFLLLTALNQAGRFSVPAFFLLAGLLTAHHAEDPGRPGGYLKRRLGRLLVPYVTWSLLLCALPWILHGRADAADLGARFLFGWTFTGGYFLLALAQLTLLAPLLLGIVRRSGSAALLLFSASLFAGVGLFAAAAYGVGPWARQLRDQFSPLLTLGIAWAPFFIAGLWAGVERRRILPWIGRHRTALAILAATSYASSLLEFRRVHELTASLGLAASFLKPTSVMFAFAVCAVFLGTKETVPDPHPAGAPGAPPPGFAGRALAEGSYAIYLLHGSIILMLCGVVRPWWQALLGTPAGPLLLGVCGILLPLAFFRVAERRAPAWARFAMFG